MGRGGAVSFRLADALRNAEFDVRVLCATAEQPGKFNGDISTTRYLPHGDISPTSWPRVLKSKSQEEYRKIAYHFAFIEKAVQWCKDNKVQIALVGNPFQEANYIHVRELYGRLKEQGVKVGLFNHDLSITISTALQTLYAKEASDWQSTSTQALKAITDVILSSIHVTEWAAIVGSPLFYEPDFLISNSEWSSRFVDPLKTATNIIVHPLMDEAYLRSIPDGAKRFPDADVLMVNPQRRKNPGIMKEIILGGKAGRTHRVLKGGWGNAFLTFKPMIEDDPRASGKHAEFIDYVEDMRQAYRSSGVVLFPSFEEGYGMTPVEAMYCGTPVISSNYPAILEAVGDGAYCLCPYRDGADKWLAAVDEVLSERDRWSSRAVMRADYLSRRQAQELKDLVAFFKAIA